MFGWIVGGIAFVISALYVKDKLTPLASKVKVGDMVSVPVTAVSLANTDQTTIDAFSAFKAMSVPALLVLQVTAIPAPSVQTGASVAGSAAASLPGTPFVFSFLLNQVTNATRAGKQVT